MYSFQDLFDAAKFNHNTSILQRLDQSSINNLVKKLCEIADWRWDDRLGSDGIVYTYFSPKLNVIKY
jgi:hypothetical protein